MGVSYYEIIEKIKELSREEAYIELLKTSEWLEFRETILNRDEYSCTNCGKDKDQSFEELPFDQWFMDYTEIQEYNQNVKQNKNEKFFEKSYPSRIVLLESVILQVHHKLYFANRIPWEYDPKFLTTLCIDCHRNEHKSKAISTYDSDAMNMKFENVPCSRCSGTGFLEEYRHFKDGICFACGGQGILVPDNPVWANV